MNKYKSINNPDKMLKYTVISMYKIYVIKSIDIIYKLPFKSTINTTTVNFFMNSYLFSKDAFNLL